MGGRSPRQIFLVVAGIALTCVAAWIILWRHGSSQAAQSALPPSIPVSVTAAAQRDVPIYYDALGTVQRAGPGGVAGGFRVGKFVSIRKGLGPLFCVTFGHF